MPVVVRRAVAADAPTLASLNAHVQSLHAEALPAVFKPPAAESFLQVATSLLREARNILLIAEVDGNPVGYAYAEVVRRPETPFRYASDLLYLHQLSVHPERRRQGAGTALLNAIRAAGQELGVQAVALDVWTFNEPAREFFRRCGFATYNERLWNA